MSASQPYTRLSLGLVVASLPFYLFPLNLGPVALSPPEAALLLCALIVGLRRVFDRRGGQRRLLPEPSFFDAPIALLLAAALLSLLVTEYFRLSLRELRTLIVEPILFFYLVRSVVGSVEDATWLLDVFLTGVTIVALLGIGQFFLGGAVTDVQGVRRVQGTYLSPNHFGLLLGRALPFLLAGAWLGVRRGPRTLAALICSTALVLTFSVGAWLGTVAAILTLSLILGGRRVVLAVGLAVVVLSLAAVATLPAERVLARLDPAQGTALVRVQLWQAAGQMLAEQPLLGIGLDNFLYRYPAYVPPNVILEPNLSHPHNLVLQFWLQLGLLGLVAISWLLGTFVARAVPATRGGRAPAERALAAGALASMANFVVHGLIDNSYFLVDTAFIFWLTLGITPTRLIADSGVVYNHGRRAGRLRSGSQGARPTLTLLDGGAP
ncbi:MAG: O-antigen ligase family protein [Chloroflexi bacterium]|nr:O-antigen ligase family protein [Chloroflexota bacterium]